MHDTPAPADLLDAVACFLREQAAPQLQGQAAFHARVAANALDIVRRQLALAPPAELEEQARLSRLLGVQGSVPELNVLLCQRIAAGTVDFDTPGLMAHLWQVTLQKLAVDQPGYESYRRLLAVDEPAPPEDL